MKNVTTSLSNKNIGKKIDKGMNTTSNIKFLYEFFPFLN